MFFALCAVVAGVVLRVLYYVCIKLREAVGVEREYFAISKLYDALLCSSLFVVVSLNGSRVGISMRTCEFLSVQAL